MARKFYRSVVKIEVLSEEPLDYEGLTDLHYMITFGDCSGEINDEMLNEEVDGPTMAKLLIAQGSDPGFFQLTEDGKDLEDEDN